MSLEKDLKNFCKLIKNENDFVCFLDESHEKVVNKIENFIYLTNPKDQKTCHKVGYCNGTKFVSFDNLHRVFDFTPVFKALRCTLKYEKNQTFKELWETASNGLEFVSVGTAVKHFKNKYREYTMELIKKKYPNGRKMHNKVKKTAEILIENKYDTIISKLILKGTMDIYHEYQTNYSVDEEIIASFDDNKIKEYASKDFENTLHDIQIDKTTYGITLDNNYIFCQLVEWYLENEFKRNNCIEQEKEKHKHYLPFLEALNDKDKMENKMTLTFIYNAEPLLDLLKVELKEQTVNRLTGEKNNLDSVSTITKMMEKSKTITCKIPTDRIYTENLFQPHSQYISDIVTSSEYPFLEFFISNSDLKKFFYDTMNIKDIVYRKKSIVK